MLLTRVEPDELTVSSTAPTASSIASPSRSSAGANCPIILTQQCWRCSSGSAQSRTRVLVGGWNTLAYDDEMLRHMLFASLTRHI